MFQNCPFNAVWKLEISFTIEKNAIKKDSSISHNQMFKLKIKCKKVVWAHVHFEARAQKAARGTAVGG